MYSTLLLTHGLMRWIVLIGLILAVCKSLYSYTNQRDYTSTDNALRHWTATFTHIQLLLGMTLYFQSPLMQYFFSNFKASVHTLNLSFFGIIHPTLMLLAIVIITVGSAKSKRKGTDSEKYRTTIIWFAIALLIILIAIPWPFSPLASRPYLR